MKKMFAIIILILAQPGLVSAAEYIDLPPCQALTADDGQYRLGLMTPLNNPDLAARSYELSLFYYQFNVVCLIAIKLDPTSDAAGIAGHRCHDLCAGHCRLVFGKTV